MSDSLPATRVESPYGGAGFAPLPGRYHAPNPEAPPRGAILYVPPFAGELPRTRNLASHQSRAFAAIGFAVLQVDLAGCGDDRAGSRAARWDLWKAELALAARWLAGRGSGSLNLWGVRLGALLAMDFAREIDIDRLILWQPFLSGRACINQLLRLELAQQVRRERGAGTVRSTATLRAQLAENGVINADGYELALPLAAAIEACDAASLRLPPCTVHWFAHGAPAPSKLAARAARLARRWEADGARLRFHEVDGPQFWADDSASGHDALLDATSAAVCAPSAGP